MRSGREPAEDIKRRLVAACQEVGLAVCDASMHLSRAAGSRLVHVSASPENWTGDAPMLSIMAMVPVSGDWPEFVDIRCSASDGIRSPMNCPWMKGRDQVPLNALIDELRATLREREQVIALMNSGVAGPYGFERTVWQTVDLLGPVTGGA